MSVHRCLWHGAQLRLECRDTDGRRCRMPAVQCCPVVCVGVCRRCCCCCCFLLSVQSELDFIAEHRAELKIGFLNTVLDSLEISVL